MGRMLPTFCPDGQRRMDHVLIRVSSNDTLVHFAPTEHGGFCYGTRATDILPRWGKEN